MLDVLLPAILLFSSQAGSNVKPVTLQHTGKAGEKLSYSVKSHVQVEVRQVGLETWLPNDLDLNYTFTEQVTEIKPGGMMAIHYKRPTMTVIQGETYDTPEKTTVDKLNLDYGLTVSPINEIVAEKDLNPQKPKGSAYIHLHSKSGWKQGAASILDFVGEIYRLALNTGSMDGSLDFAPKLPLDDVKPGDTWKKTVGFSPQKLKGKNKNAVQRLDYTYTYVGVMDSNGKNVYRVTADLSTSSNLAEFFFEATGLNSEDTLIKAIPLNLKQHIDFDLDMKTGETLHAQSQATGGFSIQTTESEQALHEERFKGGTELNLLERSQP
ncbi:MAG TPA: hypothetical protein VGL56_12120 [Fimbriimonadaceae bacterium]|jgi:hypothetical protein